MKALQRAIARVMTQRVVFGTAVTAAFATWIMLLIGGTVNPTGSSLACTWGPTDLLFPTCNGAAFPAMEGGVLYEHGHRLWGWLVGMFTVATLIGAWARPEVVAKTKWLSLFALFLVLSQGLLGGLTVYFGLKPYLSTGHLVVGYSFLALMVVMAWRLAPSRSTDPHNGLKIARGIIGITAVIVLVQIVLGGIIRHFGAGMACGADPIGCQGAGFWPDHYQQQIHMTHRFLGYTAALLVIVTAIVAARRAKAAGRPVVAKIAFAAGLVVVAQVTLGLLTIMTGEVVAVAFHTAFGGLLLTLMVALWTGFGPLGQPRNQPSIRAHTFNREATV